MIVLHGDYRFGRVDGVQGEYLVTRFHHLWVVPLFPLGSEWVMRSEAGELKGTPCRLSGKSVLAAYLRVWALVLAVLCGMFVAVGSLILIVPTSVVVAGAIASLRWRRLRDPRELRRVALQEALFGSALDPARLKPASAAALVRAAEERLAEVSGGRTARDIAQDGAASAEQAARAFVALRLAAGGARGHLRADAIAASDRILDGAAELGASDGPFRIARAPAAVAIEAPPLFQAASLRRHSLHGVIATLVAWGACGYLMAPQITKCMCGTKAEIASAGVRVLAFSSYAMWRSTHPDSPCPTVEELAEIGGSTKDPWSTPYRIRCYALPVVGRGLVAWSAGEDRTDGTHDDIASWD